MRDYHVDDSRTVRDGVFLLLWLQANLFHRQSLLHVLHFWGSLADKSIDVSNMPLMMNRMTVAEAKAEQAYMRLLALFPDSRDLLLSYARFLEDVSDTLKM